jgi:hypothetical protein
LQPRQLDLLYREVGGWNAQQFELFILQFIVAVRDSRPTYDSWQRRKYSSSRRALLIEQICNFCITQLEADFSSEKRDALVDELKDVQARAFTADFDEQRLTRYYMFAGLNALAVSIYTGRGVYINAWWFNWSAAGLWLFAIVVFTLISVTVVGPSAAVRRRRRLAAKFDDLREVTVFERPRIKRMPEVDRTESEIVPTRRPIIEIPESDDLR